MDRLALTGLTLATAGALALVASEVIAIAHASRPADKTYLLALSSGSSLYLMARSRDVVRRSAQHAASTREVRQLSCDRVVEVPAVSLGLRCREQ